MDHSTPPPTPVAPFTHRATPNEPARTGDADGGGRLSIAHLGTFPPTQCGLATFGAALLGAMTAVSPSTRVGVIDVLDRSTRGRPGLDGRIGARLVNGDADSMAAAAGFANGHDALLIEHEFGIYGGADGADILDLVDMVRSPIVAVLHTVPQAPTPRQREIIERLGASCDALIVMSGAAHRRLLGSYGVDAATVHVVPHGAHPNPPRLGESPRGKRPTVLTWGLLGPGKGIEAAIDAMALVRDIIPLPRYLVAGETHPKVFAASGERYRDSLRHRAMLRGVDDVVEFDASYRDVESLKALVRAADLVLLPYETREQVTSGVLIEAVASERPVVATDFPHARELLTTGAGIVVPHEDPEAMARAVRAALCDQRLAAVMRATARRVAASAMWPAVGRRYLDITRQCLLQRASTVRHGRVA